jgi:tRNA pseudouridine38-40 synthase
MRNIKFIVEYDGTDFHGWQRQEGLRTVQGEIEGAVERFHGRRLTVQGAGRTDAGVHAWGQVCNFEIETDLPVERIKKAAASYLPTDIVIRLAEEVPADFNARFSAISRSYIYYIRSQPTALWRRFFHVVTYPVDPAAMREAARYLLGEHDFASFTPVKSQDRPTRCRLDGLEIHHRDGIFSFTLEADHFLHHMVRVMVGTLLEVGRGRIPPERIEEILSIKSREAAGPTLPANGLFLLQVKYPA